MRTPITLALSAILVSVGCGQDGPTDVQHKAPAATVVAAPSFAVGGNKPVSGYETRTFMLTNVVAGNSAAFEVLCPTGKRALGGGYKVWGGMQATGGDVVVYESTPRVTSGTDGWRVEAVNRSADTRDIEAYVICAPI